MVSHNRYTYKIYERKGKLRNNHANITESPTISRQEANISNREITQKSRCINIYRDTLKSDTIQYTPSAGDTK